jgi:hypothetical protein
MHHVHALYTVHNIHNLHTLHSVHTVHIVHTLCTVPNVRTLHIVHFVYTLHSLHSVQTGNSLRTVHTVPIAQTVRLLYIQYTNFLTAQCTMQCFFRPHKCCSVYCHNVGAWGVGPAVPGSSCYPEEALVARRGSIYSPGVVDANYSFSPPKTICAC